MIYLGILLITALTQQAVDGHVWQACVRHYDWSAQSLNSRAASPVQKPTPFLMSVPRPARAQTDFSRRMVGDIEKQDHLRADAPQPALSSMSQTTVVPARPMLNIPKDLEKPVKSQPLVSTAQASSALRSTTASPSAYSATTHSDSPRSSNEDNTSPRSSSSNESSSSRYSRPRGRRSPTARRPPPLDLSKITAYR